MCKSIDWALEVSKELKPSSSLVLIDLARYAHHQTGICWPSREKLMQDTGLGMTAVREALADIKKAGFVVETGDKVGRTGNVKKYLLTGAETGWVVRQTSISNRADSEHNRADSARRTPKGTYQGKREREISKEPGAGQTNFLAVDYKGTKEDQPRKVPPTGETPEEVQARSDYYLHQARLVAQGKKDEFGILDEDGPYEPTPDGQGYIRGKAAATLQSKVESNRTERSQSGNSKMPHDRFIR